MGKELGAYAHDTYDHTLVSEEDFPKLVNDLKRVQGELEKKYPRCKPYVYSENWYKDLYGLNGPNICVKPQNPYNDNCIYHLTTKVVRNQVIKKEGGEA